MHRAAVQYIVEVEKIIATIIVGCLYTFSMKNGHGVSCPPEVGFLMVNPQQQQRQQQQNASVCRFKRVPAASDGSSQCGGSGQLCGVGKKT